MTCINNIFNKNWTERSTLSLKNNSMFSRNACAEGNEVRINIYTYMVAASNKLNSSYFLIAFETISSMPMCMGSVIVSL